MSSYFTKFKILRDELVHYQSFSACTCVCTCGSQRNQLCAQQTDQVFRFLMGLNESYSTVTSQILITEPLPALNKAYSLILQEEKCRQVGQADLVIEPTALYANNLIQRGSKVIKDGIRFIKAGIKVCLMVIKVERMAMQRKKGLCALTVELLVM